MPLALHHIVIDSHDLPAQARFWSEALRWQILSVREREIVVGPHADAPVGLCLMPSPDPKSVKNRVHLDLYSAHQEAEVERVVGLGARVVRTHHDPEDDYVVLADPEGNEFCICVITER